MKRQPVLKTTLISFLVCLLILPASGQKAKKIQLLHANSLEYEAGKSEAKKLIGNVGFEHDGVKMYCDSAYLYSKGNSMDAWGNVRIKQGDTLNIYGDSLKYDGDTRLAQLRGNIRFADKDMTLTTNYLDYNREKEMAYYVGGGRIVNRKKNNTLTSDVGYYYPEDKHFFFKDKVEMINPDYQINSDTLMYNTNSEVTWFYGPSVIRSSENTIYCENGWYNTITNKASFSENAWIWSGSQKVSGDSIFYDRNAGIGEAFGNIGILDTIENILLNGNYTINYEKDSIAIITDSAMLTQFFKQDTLYLHADTLLSAYDSTGEYRIMHAWHKVKYYKPDMQGKCDSLVFSNADSTITMFRDPVLWSEENQLTSDSMQILMYDGEIRSMKMDYNAFIASMEDTIKFNQIKGDSMLGHFKDNQLWKIDVFGNGQTVYYAQNDSGKSIGANRADCEDLIIYTDSSKVSKIVFLNKPKATLYPLNKLDKKEVVLDGLNWRGSIRPLRKEDIFIWKEEAEEEEIEETSEVKQQPKE